MLFQKSMRHSEIWCCTFYLTQSGRNSTVILIQILTLHQLNEICRQVWGTEALTNKDWAHLTERNRCDSEQHVERGSLTKEQMSSHQPQMSGKTPISTTTSRDTWNGSRVSVSGTLQLMQTHEKLISIQRWWNTVMWHLFFSQFRFLEQLA